MTQWEREGERQEQTWARLMEGLAMVASTVIIWGVLFCIFFR